MVFDLKHTPRYLCTLPHPRQFSGFGRELYPKQRAKKVYVNGAWHWAYRLQPGNSRAMIVPPGMSNEWPWYLGGECSEQ